MTYINLHTYSGSRLAIRTDRIESVHEDTMREMMRGGSTGGGTILCLLSVEPAYGASDQHGQRRRQLAVREPFDVVMNTLAELED